MVLNKLKLINALGTVLCVVGLSSSVNAEDEISDNPNNHSLSGSLSSTLVYTDNTALYGKKGTKIVNQLVLNDSYSISDHLTLVGSVNINNTVHDNYESQVDYASVNCNINLYGVTSNIRLGRVKYDIGLLEAKRNNPASRYAVFLPLSSYFPAFDRYAQSLDGLQIELTKSGSIGNLTASSTYGKAILHKGDQSDIFFGYFHVPLDGTFTTTEPVSSHTIKFQNLHWKIQYNVTTVDVLYDHDPAPTPINQRHADVAMHHRMHTTGIRYENEDMFLSGEYIEHDLLTEPIAWFIRGGFNVSEKTIIYGGYATLFHGNNVPSPLKTKSPYDRTGEEYSVGITHYYTPKLMLKAQYSTGKGTVWFSHPASEPEWSILSLSVVYKFDLI